MYHNRNTMGPWCLYLLIHHQGKNKDLDVNVKFTIRLRLKMCTSLLGRWTTWFGLLELKLYFRLDINVLFKIKGVFSFPLTPSPTTSSLLTSSLHGTFANVDIAKCISDTTNVWHFTRAKAYPVTQRTWDVLSCTLWDTCHKPFLFLRYLSGAIKPGDAHLKWAALAEKPIKDRNSNVRSLPWIESLPSSNIELTGLWCDQWWVTELADVSCLGEGASNRSVFHASDPICLSTVHRVPH